MGWLSLILGLGGTAQRADHGRLCELLRQEQGDLAWACAWVLLTRGAHLRGWEEPTAWEKQQCSALANDELR